MKRIELGDETGVTLVFYWELTNLYSNVDIDVSCVLLNKSGQIRESVFYNNLDCPGCIHSGDVRGEGGGENELIKIHFDELEEEVEAIVLSIHCYSGGKLNFIKNAKVTFQGRRTEKLMMEYDIKTEDSSSLIFGILHKRKTSWIFQQVLRKCEGRNFFEIKDKIFEETLYLFPSRGVPVAIEGQFDLIKHGILNIGNEPKVYLSMGWDCKEGVDLDIDASIVAVNKDNEVEYVVYYDRIESPDGAIFHHGDSQGDKTDEYDVEGDNELISVNLGKIPTRIIYLFFVITVFDLEATFEDVTSCWVRFLNQKREELFCYEIDCEEIREQEKQKRKQFHENGSSNQTPEERKKRNAKVMAKIFRNPRVPLKWKFEPMNQDFGLSREMNVLELAPILQRKEEYFVQPKLSTFEVREVRKLKKSYNVLVEQKKEWEKKFHSADFFSGLEILKDKEYQDIKIQLSQIMNLTDVECATPLTPQLRSSGSRIFMNHDLRFCKKK